MIVYVLIFEFERYGEIYRECKGVTQNLAKAQEWENETNSESIYSFEAHELED